MTDPTGSNSSTQRRSLYGRWRLHPAPRFLVAGGAAFVVDLGSLRILHGTLGIALAPATAGAFAIAFLVNFSLSRKWTFVASAQSGDARRQFGRYLVLVGLNLLATLLFVVGLSSVGMNYLWAKFVAVCVNSVGNYFAYRHWVFAVPPVL